MKTSSSQGYSQSFRVDGYDLSGVSSIDFSTSFGVGYTPILGAPNFGFNQTSAPDGVVSLTRSLIYNDPLFSHTGNSNFSGSFAYNDVVYGFSNGYLSEYSVSAQVGTVPSLSSSIRVFGELTSGFSQQTQEDHPSVFVPSPRSISITNDYSSTNRIKGFDYSLSLDRQPKYSLEGGIYPDFVGLIEPLKIQGSLSIEVGDMSPKDMYSFSREILSPSFVIIMKDRTLNNTLMTLPINNAQIISQSMTATVDSPLTINLSYEGQL